VFSKESVKFKTDIQRLNTLQIQLRMFGPLKLVIHKGVENFIGFEF